MRCSRRRCTRARHPHALRRHQRGRPRRKAGSDAGRRGCDWSGAACRGGAAARLATAVTDLSARCVARRVVDARGGLSTLFIAAHSSIRRRCSCFDRYRKSTSLWAMSAAIFNPERAWTAPWVRSRRVVPVSCLPLTPPSSLPSPSSSSLSFLFPRPPPAAGPPACSYAASPPQR